MVYTLGNVEYVIFGLSFYNLNPVLFIKIIFTKGWF